MIYIDLFIGLAVGLFLFLCCLKAYTTGLAHGKDISKGIAPVVNVNPVKTFSDYLDNRNKEEPKPDCLFNIMNYDPYKEVSEDE